MERRRAQRFALRFPVLFTCHNEGFKQGGGFTRDIGAAGAYVLFENEACPAPGEALTIQAMLPPIGVHAHGVRFTFDGRVVRRHGPGEESGFAVVTEFDIRGNGGSLAEEAN